MNNEKDGKLQKEDLLNLKMVLSDSDSPDLSNSTCLYHTVLVLAGSKLLVQDLIQANWIIGIIQTQQYLLL